MTRNKVVAAASAVMLGGLGAGTGTASWVLPTPGTTVATLSPSLPRPWSTAANHGYEDPNTISPLVPPSYRALVAPKLVGVQFIADRPQNLRRDGLKVAVAGPRSLPLRPARVYPNGFVGVAMPSMPPGDYRVTFAASGFNASPVHWSIRVVAAPHPPPSAYPGVLAALNAYRAAVGEPPARWSQRLAWAASAHAAYLAKNGYQRPGFHTEAPGRPGFTGVTPWDRDLAFGWPSSLTGEVGIEWTRVLPAPQVIADLIDTVYHRLSLLSPNLEAVGAGTSTGASGAVVMDLGYGYQGRLPPVVVYPYPGQTGVPVSWIDMETPDPVPGGSGRLFGYPITVDFPTVQSLADVRASVRGRFGPVPAVIDAPGQNGLGQNQLGVVPRSPLTPYTVYTVSVKALARFNDGSQRTVSWRWQFATGGGADSLVALPAAGRRLAVTVVEAGSGTPVGGRLVEVIPASGGQPVAQGTTSGSGTAVLAMPPPSAHPRPYLVLDSAGNALRIWW